MRSSAEQGTAIAQYRLGFLYNNGDGVEQSHTEAVKWFRLAAEKGLHNAQNDLGVCYAKGLGVEKSMDEAVKWWTLAADKGSEKAKENLAKMQKRKTQNAKGEVLPNRSVSTTEQEAVTSLKK